MERRWRGMLVGKRSISQWEKRQTRGEWRGMACHGEGVAGVRMACHGEGVAGSGMQSSGHKAPKESTSADVDVRDKEQKQLLVEWEEKVSMARNDRRISGDRIRCEYVGGNVRWTG